MIGILAEKPSAMRNMAKALGGTSGKYNNEDYVLVAARGHLYEFADPDKQVGKDLAPKYKSWDISKLPWNETDFSWKYEKKKDTADTLKNIQSVLSKCDEICIATDDDPTGEGELLAWEILDQLKFKPKKWSRMYFVDESAKEITKSFVNRKPIASMRQDKDYIKAFYRSRWDFLSMQFTRIATKCGDGKSVLRQGRLKSAMVLIVGDGLKAVAEYKKIPFYQNRFKDENNVVYSNPDEPSFPQKDQVPNVYHSSAVVVDDKSMKSTAPPAYLDLAALASRLSGKGIKSKDVLAVYQKMYEDQIVSYPRTEDKFISPEQFNELLPLVDKIAALIGVDKNLLTHRAARKTHVKVGGAHGANRPGPHVPASLDDLNSYGACAKDIYLILAKNYLATMAEDYEYEAQKGHLKDYPAFKGSTTVPKKMGWKLVFNDADDNDDNSTAGLGTMANPFIHEGFPPKPPTPTMKWLMAQLEKRDVGTGATRVSTYSEVTSESAKFPLMKDTKGKLSFTEYGEMSYRILPGTNIGSLDMTEKLMIEMREIAEGKKNPEECLKSIQRMVIEDIATMTKNGESMRKELNIMSNETNAAERYEGTWNGQSVKFKREWSGHKFTDDECEKLCDGETIEIEAISSKTGKPFKCKGKLEEQTYNGRNFVGFKADFSGGSSGGSAKVPDEWCQHKFTDDEKLLLEAGNTVVCEDFISKKGNKFKARVRYGKNDKGFMGIIPEFE